MTGMPPPTSTDEQGTVIDGTAHSEEWRQKQRAAQRPQEPRSPEATPSVPAADLTRRLTGPRSSVHLL